MIKLLDFHQDPPRHYGQSRISKFLYYIVMIGCGGNGGYAVQRMTKMLYAFNNVRSFLMLADPDTVEEKNLLRQPFIPSDIGKKKADVLAKRYGSTYGLKIGSYSDAYIESVEQLESLFSHTDYMHADGQFIQKVLIGAVDNDFSRKIMNDYFEKTDDLIYIDAGIEGIFLPGGGEKPQEQWTREELMEHLDSGHSGQVVVGVKKKGSVILPPLNEVYPIDAKDAIPPSHNCGIVPYQPQHMIANERAALEIATVMNELFTTNSVLVHVVNFNSRTSNGRPTYVEDVLLTPDPGQAVPAGPTDRTEDVDNEEFEDEEDEDDDLEEDIDSDAGEIEFDGEGDSAIRKIELSLSSDDIESIKEEYELDDLSNTKTSDVYNALITYADDALGVDLLDWYHYNLEVSIEDNEGKTYLVARDVPNSEN